MFDAALRALALLSFATAPGTPATLESAAASGVVVPLDTVVFAGGCFWGVQGVFQHVKGVQTATSGYSGGTVANPSHPPGSTGKTGQAQAGTGLDRPPEGVDAAPLGGAC